jgi:hypothetical protein
MDELTQHITAIAAASDHLSSLPAGVGALTAIVAARTLLEMTEGAPETIARPTVVSAIGEAVEQCDHAARELVR